MRAIKAITNDKTGIFQEAVLDGLHTTAQQTDFQVEVLTTDNVNADPPLDDTKGVVVIANAVSNDVLSRIYKMEIPITLVSHRHPELPIPAVMSDNAQGIRTLMAHLIRQCGRSSPVFIRGIPEQQDSQERERAFRQELLRHNIASEASRIIDGRFSSEAAVVAIQKLLAAGFPFDCLIAADYVMGIAAQDTLQSAGISVPGEVSIVGYGDDRAAKKAGLTTVSANIRELGQRAARQIISQINGLHISGTTTINVELIIRDSCGCHEPL
jgi:LacI family transcriptional regulator